MADIFIRDPHRVDGGTVLRIDDPHAADGGEPPARTETHVVMARTRT